MPEAQILLKLVESIGFPAVVFAIWYLYHRGQVKAWEAQMSASREREDRVFGLLSGQLETLQMLVGQSARIESKIDGNQICPIVREGYKHA